MTSPHPQQRLDELAGQLSETALRSLLDFAEFLLERDGPRERVVHEPEPLPRPAEESVVAAMKRLRESYHMLDHGKMLHEASALMAQHLMQGRPAAEVIDDLERIFVRHYERYATRQGE